jgi:hypothetical protein
MAVALALVRPNSAISRWIAAGHTLDTFGVPASFGIRTALFTRPSFRRTASPGGREALPGSGNGLTG